ncbi:MAG: hypothetical protein V4521_06950 [Pseudomonadota bacterium]
MNTYVVAFLRAILAGVLTASALPFLFALVIVISSLTTGQPTQALATLYVLLIIVVSIAAVIASVSLFIGLPVSYVLRRLRRYSNQAHVGAGVVLGFISFPVCFAVIGDQDSDASLFLLYLYAALAGGVTADSWWRNTSDLIGSDLALI